MKNSVLYYHEMSSPSRKVRIAILEKQIASIELVSVDIIAGEQFQEWFLDLNPKGEVPVFVHYDDEDKQTVVTESTDIMKFIDAKYEGQPVLFKESSSWESLQSSLDTLGTFALTWGVFSHYQSLSEYTKVIRYPYSKFIKFHSLVKRRMFVEKPGLLLQVSERMGPSHPAHSALRAKADALKSQTSLFYDPSEFENKVLRPLENILDHVERDILSKEDRLGPFLCGPGFSGLDISLTALLFRLYQLGLEEYAWGSRPNLSVYYNLASTRDSVSQATQNERNHGNEAYWISDSNCADTAAYVGLLGVLALSGVYIFKKLRK
eukprot:TRINITY_DN22533_c0_g1_i1.p1 TRINITY_DN22533_c0_g1~~TRINITY_DN22533_c0_g1_i1.p1  ORF type:complete len:321 (+),score=67.09 TRINITY_DN22533_c0_g1_i1:207-1169(+)